MEAVTSREMAALELNSEYLGVSTIQLMENAGGAVAREVAKRFNSGDRVVVVAGTGGKGGDGMVAARHLAGGGFKVSLILVGKPSEIRREAVRRNWEVLELMRDSLSITVASDSSEMPEISGEVVVDALLGTGAMGPLKPPVSRGVTAINSAAGFKVAIDLPTGVDPDTGELLGEAVKADLTVTLHRPKIGLLRAKTLAGEVVVAPIGIPPEADNYVGPGDVYLAIKPRMPDTHKGDYGRVLVVGGSRDFHGAPTLAAMAAFRTGVDLVYVATPEAVAHAVAAASPALIVIKLEGDFLSTKNIRNIERWIDRATAVVIGPGLGLEAETREAVKEAVEAVEARGLPLLLDADGLKAFSEFKRPLSCPLVLTPHAGEYETLTKERVPKTHDDRVRHVSGTAMALHAVVLLKGPVDIVSDGRRVKVNRFVHNPGMTVGGTGDVLSGIVGALLSQGLEPFRAAAAGIFINGAAGDFAFRDKGYHILPTDLLEWIPRVMDYPMDHTSVRRIEGSLGSVKA
jgi:NAD(P)H-hydrate epimerase